MGIQSRDEIGWLAGAFNKMSAGLREGLEREKRHAEAVARAEQERAEELQVLTDTLSESNRTLEGEVVERGRIEETLRQKNVELEQMNQIMMGREERVLELKQEVNELCKQLNRPSKYSG